MSGRWGFGSTMILSELEEELDKIKVGGGGTDTQATKPSKWGFKLGTKDKVKYLWNASKMDHLLLHLRGQSQALNLVLTALQSTDIANINSMFLRPEVRRVVQQVQADTLSLLKTSEPGSRPASIYSVRSESSSDRTFIAPSTYSLETELQKSQVYRQAEAQGRTLKKREVQEPSDNTANKPAQAKPSLWRHLTTPATRKRLGSYLFSAIRSENIQRLQSLLEQGADPNVLDESSDWKVGHTYPLQVAIQVGNVEIAEMLLRYGADANSTKGSLTSLELKFASNEPPSPFLRTWQKLTPLLQAITEEKPSTRMVELLLQHKASLDKGFPLHVAILSTSEVDLVKLLLTHGASIEAKDRKDYTEWGLGMTPLMYAAVAIYSLGVGDGATSRLLAIVELLLQNEAHVGATNSKGYSPLSFATYPKLRSLLLKYGANPNCKTYTEPY